MLLVILDLNFWTGDLISVAFCFPSYEAGGREKDTAGNS
jgi:hypothetical protein